MGKKKATGMSKRESFLDRAVIAENKAIMRFNQSMEDDARGTPRRVDGGQPRRGRREEGPGGGSRAPRSAGPRAPRAPAVSPEQEARLRDAAVTAAGETGLEQAGLRAVEELLAHGGFDRATDAGWQVAVGGHPDERGSEEWELLRTAWRAVRLALLEVWAVDHPDAAPILERERKEASRAAKTRSRPRRSDGRRPAGRAGGRPGGSRRPVPAPPAAAPVPDGEPAAGAEQQVAGPDQPVAAADPSMAVEAAVEPAVVEPTAVEPTAVEEAPVPVEAGVRPVDSET